MKTNTNLLSTSTSVFNKAHLSSCRCIYDGITAFILDPNSIEYINCQSLKFNLEDVFDRASKMYLRTEGRIQNLSLETGINPRGKGFYCRGSIHKFDNNRINYDNFHWEELQHKIANLKNIFQFNLCLVDICGLEGGVNIQIPKTWNIKTRELIENIIYMVGRANFSSETFKDGGIIKKIEKSNSGHKFYDKGVQNGLDCFLLKLECYYKNYKALKKFSIRTLGDLTDIQKHKLVCEDLISTFDSMIIRQPELFSISTLSKTEKDLVHKFSNGEMWVALRKENRYKFNKIKNEYNIIINRHCKVNFKEEIIKMIRAAIS